MFGLFKKSSNPYDEMLKELVRRELRGEPVGFSDYLYALDDLTDEPEKIATEEDIHEVIRAKDQFFVDLNRFNLSLTPRYGLCR